MTENGLLRIVGHPRYPNSPGTPAAVAPVLAGLCALPGHVFWPDDISLLDARYFHHPHIHGHKQLTDLYLLALAVRNGGRLVSFDQRIPLSAVQGARAEHLAKL